MRLASPRDLAAPNRYIAVFATQADSMPSGRRCHEPLKPRVPVDQIAEHPGVKCDSSYRWIERKGLPAYRVGSAVEVQGIRGGRSGARRGARRDSTQLGPRRNETAHQGTERANDGRDSGNLIVQGDNLHALKALLPRYGGPENETNFLAFPQVRDAIVIFGAGYGWDALARSHWLRKCPIHYWGDIDTHGFGILDQLRGYFDHVASFLMDRATLDAHAHVWGSDDKPLRGDLHRLTSEERDLYDDLRDNRIRAGLRLEQEHIGFQWLAHRLQQLLDGTAVPIQARAL